MSICEQTGLTVIWKMSYMAVARHMPEDLPDPTESSCPGFRLGVWPPQTQRSALIPLQTTRDIEIAPCQVVPAGATAIGNERTTPARRRPQPNHCTPEAPADREMEYVQGEHA